MDRQPALTIATIRSAYKEPFGVPRQSGLVPTVETSIVFEPDFRDSEFVRGIDGFSHVWLIWEFSMRVNEQWLPTATPPALQGDTVGVFASRSPLRPNYMGLSAVELKRVDYETREGPILHVAGADLIDGTPILDIKPYVPSDARTDIRAGYLDAHRPKKLTVEFSQGVEEKVPEQLRKPLRDTLSLDPRPSSTHDTRRIYDIVFGDQRVLFAVAAGHLIVHDVVPNQPTE